MKAKVTYYYMVQNTMYDNNYHSCCMDTNGILYFANVGRKSFRSNPYLFTDKKEASKAIKRTLAYATENNLSWNKKFRIIPVVTRNT